MPLPLNVLLVEDNPVDAELILRKLRQAGFEPRWHRVDTEAGYIEHLQPGLDLVLSDYQMPLFDGLRALVLFKQRGLEIPFILVSGKIGEEAAVEAIKLGAVDFLMKDRLGRLGSAVTHALAESQSRRERGRADADLRASEARFRLLAENIHEIFWITDPTQNQVLYISPAYERVWGQSCESLYATPRAWSDAIHPDDRGRVLHAVAAKQAIGTYNEEYRILRPDGSQRWIRDRAFPVHGPGGDLQRYVGVAEDITESKKLQDQFLRAQRMEAIGTLAGGIAHDLNNIMGPMLMVPALLKDCNMTAPERQLLDLIERGARRSTNIIRQLLTFSRGSGGDRVKVQLSNLVDEMAEIMRATFPCNIMIDNRLARNLRPVEGDPTQLHQVLMNLCVNARDAMPRGGTLSIKAENVELSETDVLTHAPIKAGSFVAMSVADTGDGIPPEIIERIFDPFFTTKSAANGTGLGLSTVLGIVRSHGGFITVESTPGRGTAFTIRLPVFAGATADGLGAAGDAPPHGHGELILVVDDEAQILTTTKLILERQGYRVITARDGAIGLSTFLEHRNSVRLVVTDVRMPVMGGVPLMRALRAVAPGLKLLATTGFVSREIRAELLTAGANGILAKPWEPHELLAAIHSQLSMLAPGATPDATGALPKEKRRGPRAASTPSRGKKARMHV